MNLNPQCEPRLGKRGIFEGLKGRPNLGDAESVPALDPQPIRRGHTLLDIAERAGFPFATIRAAADVLEGCGLLKPA